MSSVEINSVLAQMRALQASLDIDTPAASTPVASGPNFGEVLHNSLSAVSDVQKTSADLSMAFAAGDPNVELSQVMVAMQKSSLSFEATTQVRNKLLGAYKEVMNMTI